MIHPNSSNSGSPSKFFESQKWMIDSSCPYHMTPPLNSVPDYCALHICGLSTIQHLNTSPLDSLNFLPILENVKFFLSQKVLNRVCFQPGVTHFTIPTCSCSFSSSKSAICCLYASSCLEYSFSIIFSWSYQKAITRKYFDNV